MIKSILWELHDSKIGGHSEVSRTMKRKTKLFWWPGIQKIVTDYVSNCLIYQQTKSTTQRPMELLMPLPIPKVIWEDISMDFITGQTVVQGKYVIIVVVDRLSKFAHFRSLKASYSAKLIANYFVQNIIKLYGYPLFITSEKG